MSPCWMRLTNGWTVSISEDDTPPALCSVAAWPSANDDLPSGSRGESDYFGFGDGRIDQRCFTLADVREALAIVSAAPPPAIAA